MLEYMMRSGDAIDNPPFLFEAALDVAAIGEHCASLLRH
jgi:hypothetical protein